MKKIIGRDLYQFVSEHQGCTAEEAAEGLGTDVATVKAVFRNTQRPQSQSPIFRFEEGGVQKYRTGLFSTLEALVKDMSPHPLETAIHRLVETLGHHVKKAIDAELEVLIQTEVDVALADMQNRIRSKILVPENKNAVQEEPKEPKNPEQLIRLARSSMVKEKEALAKEESVKFDGPVGNVVTNDVASTRTSHKPKKVPEVVAPTAVETVVAVSPKQKVVIVGIHTNKQALIRSEYGDRLDLRMLNPDQIARIKTTVHEGDTALLMVDFVGHRHQYALDSAKAKTILCRCGLTGLRDELNSICGE